MVRQAPAGHNRAAAGDNSGDSVSGERHIPQQHARVDGHVINALLALFNNGVPVDLPGQRIGVAIDFLQCLVNRDCANRNG